jgi:hypothetical protein
MFERILAKVGTLGVLAILLTVSIFVNLYQLRNAGKADARCATRIAELEQKARAQADARDADALDIAGDTAADAQESVQVIEKETVRYVDRIRRVPVEVPAHCPRALPDGVRDALADAAAAANRPL